MEMVATAASGREEDDGLQVSMAYLLVGLIERFSCKSEVLYKKEGGLEKQKPLNASEGVLSYHKMPS
ncbi:hypothetical protein E2562_004127 [Oryza meyeriana var. granulata]|uniref:Uncharacterized protein n=1 Tax=Oryza meyeriana var. granulata TaxID=110450 RepID=A0A6G1EV62_9ORYZ|nr:hypothetical protein E2562_004127 [Oryza meyeriana var. granulata]